MTVIARDLLGAAVAVPEGVEAEVWRRFCARVVMLPGGCHLWTGPPRDDGYAQFHVPAGALAVGRRVGPWRAHRFAYVALTGEGLDVDAQVMHRCDQPLCVPITIEAQREHLVAGDNLANVVDRETKGRTRRLGRYRLPVPSRADQRGQAARSQAIHQALAEALGLDEHGRPTQTDVDRAHLAALVEEIDAAGDYFTDWTPLPLAFPPPTAAPRPSAAAVPPVSPMPPAAEQPALPFEEPAP